MRWKCCPICTGPHDTWDCEKAQKIIETHTGLPQVTAPANTAVELILEQTYGPQEPKRARWHRSWIQNEAYTIIR